MKIFPLYRLLTNIRAAKSAQQMHLVWLPPWHHVVHRSRERYSFGLLQGLQAWLVGPQLTLKEGASCSAIVLAVDQAAPMPQRQLTKLLLQASLSMPSYGQSKEPVMI